MLDTAACAHFLPLVDRCAARCAGSSIHRENGRRHSKCLHSGRRNLSQRRLRIGLREGRGERISAAVSSRRLAGRAASVVMDERVEGFSFEMKRLSSMSQGWRTLLLTMLLAGAAAGPALAQVQPMGAGADRKSPQARAGAGQHQAEASGAAPRPRPTRLRRAIPTSRPTSRRRQRPSRRRCRRRCGTSPARRSCWLTSSGSERGARTPPIMIRRDLQTAIADRQSGDHFARRD